jgi:hypothetical protein
MPQDDNRHFLPDLSVGPRPQGGITLKALTSEGEPVTLSASEARRIAAVLSDLADADDA